MNENRTAILINKDTEEGQFTLLCDYGDTISSRTTIVQNGIKNEFYLYTVVPPFPTFNEYCEGNDFEEGNIISIHDKWELAKQAQVKLKPSPL